MAKKLSPMEMKASKKVLDELRGEAKSMMNEKMGKLKKVTVASDSKEGLKKGLEKAEEILEGDEEKCGMCGKMPCECEEMEDESEEMESEDSEEMSEEEIDAKIAKLMAMKKK